jgi:hypothetical protein
MKHFARIFNCVRCHRQVIICSCCDRGNIYCGSTCSQISHKESLQASEKRYQKTYRGKLKHAERQKHYRERLAEKVKIVTDTGSTKTYDNDLLQFEVNECADSIHNDEIHCHFCGCGCDSSLRVEFLTQSKTYSSGVWPLGP